MAKYISLDALLAKIDRLNSNADLSTRHGQGLADAYFAVKKLINTAKVKNIDLDKEIDKELNSRRWEGEYIDIDKFRESAKHFIELGLRIQKGGEV